MRGVVMRVCSNRHLIAVLSGLAVSVLLLGAIRARNEGPAEKQVIAVSEHSKAPTTLDFCVVDLRGSLP